MDKGNELATCDKNEILDMVSEIIPALTPFSKTFGKKVHYISDIHIECHTEDSDLDSVKKYINKMVKDIVNNENIDSYNMVVVLGDVANNPEIVKYFYKRLKIQLKYKPYLLEKNLFHHKLMWKAENDEEKLGSNLKNIENKAAAIKEIFEKECKWLSQYFTLEEAVQYKDKKPAKQYSDENIFDFFYRNKQAFSNFCKKHNVAIPDYFYYHWSKMKQLYDELNELEDTKKWYICNYNDKVEEGTVDNSIKGYTVYLSQCLNYADVVCVLGNHELMYFSSVSDAVDYYSDFFKKEKINFLHNKSISFDTCGNRSIHVVGGIGFAKNEKYYNAENICTTNPPMSLEEEACETDLFLQEYHSALDIAKQDDVHLVVLTHYPVRSWIDGALDSQCTYFCGHDHRNYGQHTETIDLYADNQIGYHGTPAFKKCELGYRKNPYMNLKDGYYKTTVEDYVDFMHYSGESVKGTKPITNQIEKFEATLYVVKKAGFYGFFLANSKKYIFVCVGGKVRKISTNTDIEMIYNNFEDVVSKCLAVLVPIRTVEEKISSNLKELGFDGTIHGLIIDIDFYNHIMINPYSGTLEYYYSPVFGIAKHYDSLSALLEDKETGIETKKKENALAVIQKSETELIANDFVTVERKDIMYKLSSEMKKIERLFTSRTLRFWINDL